MGVEMATPGPWSHNEGNPTRIIGPDDETVAVLYGGTVGIDQQFENAELVARTPSLYAYISERASGGEAKAKEIVDSIDGEGTASSSWSYDDWNPRRISDVGGTNIASVFGGRADDAIQLANAHLIAAAPAMHDYVNAKANDGDESARAILQETEANI